MVPRYQEAGEHRALATASPRCGAHRIGPLCCSCADDWHAPETASRVVSLSDGSSAMSDRCRSAAQAGQTGLGTLADSGWSCCDRQGRTGAWSNVAYRHGFRAAADQGRHTSSSRWTSTSCLPDSCAELIRPHRSCASPRPRYVAWGGAPARPPIAGCCRSTATSTARRLARPPHRVATAGASRSLRLASRWRDTASLDDGPLARASAGDLDGASPSESESRPGPPCFETEVRPAEVEDVRQDHDRQNLRLVTVPFHAVLHAWPAPSERARPGST